MTDYPRFSAPFAANHLINMGRAIVQGLPLAFEVPRHGPLAESIHPQYYPAENPLQATSGNAQDNADLRRSTNPFPEDEPRAEQEWSIKNGAGQELSRTKLGGDARLADTGLLGPSHQVGTQLEAASDTTHTSNKAEDAPRKAPKKKAGKKTKGQEPRNETFHGTSATNPPSNNQKGNTKPSDQGTESSSEQFSGEPRLVRADADVVAPTQQDAQEFTAETSQSSTVPGPSGSESHEPVKSPLLRPASSLTVSKRASTKTVPITPARSASRTNVTADTARARHADTPEKLFDSPEIMPKDVDVQSLALGFKNEREEKGEIVATMASLMPVKTSESNAQAVRPSNARSSSSMNGRPQHRQITPWRSMTGQSSVNTPGTEDVDDSFQTAAESPESSRKVSKGKEIAPHVGNPAAKLTDVHPSQSAEAQPSSSPKAQVNTSEVLKSHAQEDISPTLQAGGADQADPVVKVEASDVGDHKSEDIGMTVTESEQQLLASQAKPVKDTLKPSGPKQTESLSPFARMSQAKKKQKKVKAKAKGKSKADKGTKSRTQSVSVPGSAEQGENSVSKDTSSLQELSAKSKHQTSSGLTNDGSAEASTSPTKNVLKGLKEGMARPLKYLTGGRTSTKSTNEDTKSTNSLDNPGAASIVGALPNSEAPRLQPPQAEKLNESRELYEDADFPSSPSTMSVDLSISPDRRNEQFSFRFPREGHSANFGGLDGANSERAISEGANSSSGASDSAMVPNKGKGIVMGEPLEQATHSTESSLTVSSSAAESRSQTPAPTPRKISAEKPHLIQAKKNTLSARKKRKAKKPSVKPQDEDAGDDSKALAKVSNDFIYSLTSVENSDGTKDWHLDKVEKAKPERKKFVRKTPTERENERRENLRYPMRKLEHQEKLSKFEKEGDEQAYHEEEQAWARYERKRNGEEEPFLLTLMERFGLGGYGLRE